MPASRRAMRKIVDVLRLKFETGLSHERIAAATKVSKGAVTKYVQRARDAGLGWPLPPDMDEARLEALLFPHAAPAVERYAAPDFARLHQELKRKGVMVIRAGRRNTREPDNHAHAKATWTASTCHSNLLPPTWVDGLTQARGDDQRRLVSYWITSSARSNTDCGIVNPRALAVFRLMTKEYRTGCSNGRSLGLAPFRILST